MHLQDLQALARLQCPISPVDDPVDGRSLKDAVRTPSHGGTRGKPRGTLDPQATVPARRCTSTTGEWSASMVPIGSMDIDVTTPSGTKEFAAFVANPVN